MNKLTEKEKDILESVLYYAKENYYVLWHAGEMKTKRYEEYALAIESIKKKIWTSDYKLMMRKKHLMILQLIMRGLVTMVKMTNTIQIRMTMDNIYMKQTKSDIVVTKFGTLVHSLNKILFHEIIGVHAISARQVQCRN